MDIGQLTSKVPTDKEIADTERRLAEMKRVREEAKKAVVAAMASDEVLDALGRDQLVQLLRRIQARVVGSHRKVRGSRVPDDLRASLVSAVQSNKYTLSQLAGMFNLSISYISRVKSELKKSGDSTIMNAYEDEQLRVPERVS